MTNFLLILLLQTCPTATPSGIDFLAVPRGCPAPSAGFWYTPDAHQKVLSELARRQALADERQRLLDAARADLAETREACVGQVRSLQGQVDDLRVRLLEVADKLKAAGSELLRCTEPPSRLAWAGVGAGVGVVVCAGTVLLGASL